MVGLDSDALKRGEKIGRSVAAPIAHFFRAGDADPAIPVVYAGPVPFHVVSGGGRVNKVSVYPGTATILDGTTSIAISIRRGSTTISLWSGTVGVWTALTKNVLSSTPVEMQEGDLFVGQVTLGEESVLPALLFTVEAEFT